jgi:hypothetical protein
MQGGGQEDPTPKRELSDILSEEFAAIGERDRLAGIIGPNRSIETALNEASQTTQNANPPPRNSAEAAEAREKACRRRLYQIGYGLDFNALCLSGGGIRSAAISLGVIQALVDKGLLNQFQYLSTVSGGGYIGSWLSAWLHHTDDAKEVLARLGSDRSNFWTRKRHRSSTYASTATILHPKLGCSRPIPGQRYRSCCAISPSTG